MSLRFGYFVMHSTFIGVITA